MTNDASRPVAVITGAARGLGFATAKRLLEAGYAVCVLDIHERLIGEHAEREASEPDRFMAALASVTDPDDIAGVVERVLERWGRIDVLVNNAGLNRRGGILEHTLEDWNAVLAVNLTGAFICSAAVAPVMRDGIEAGRQSGGLIVNIGSTAGGAQGAGSIAYATTKGGLHVFTKVLAHELGPHRHPCQRHRARHDTDRVGGAQPQHDARGVGGGDAAAPPRAARGRRQRHRLPRLGGGAADHGAGAVGVGRELDAIGRVAGGLASLLCQAVTARWRFTLRSLELRQRLAGGARGRASP